MTSFADAVAARTVNGRLWFYTNYHCNLQCSYCLTESGPTVRRRELDADAILERAAEATRDADLVIALGSTLSVYPAASFPLSAAERGVPYIILNRGETDHDRHPAVTLRIEGEVGEIFPASVDAALA